MFDCNGIFGQNYDVVRIEPRKVLNRIILVVNQILGHIWFDCVPHIQTTALVQGLLNRGDHIVLPRNPGSFYHGFCSRNPEKHVFFVEFSCQNVTIHGGSENDVGHGRMPIKIGEFLTR